MKKYMFLCISIIFIFNFSYASQDTGSISIDVPESVVKSRRIFTDHHAVSMLFRENETEMSIVLGIPKYQAFLTITEKQAKKLGVDLYQLAKDIQSKKIAIHIYTEEDSTTTDRLKATSFKIRFK